MMNLVIFVSEFLFYKIHFYYSYSGSLGILLYTLLSGNTPFALDRNDSHELILARTAVKLQFTGPTWDRVSHNAKVIPFV
jgi:serine/threonine protein kinase